MSRELMDVGIDWMGVIPKKWGIKRLGMIFDERNEKVNDTDYPPLSVTKNGIVPQLDSAAKSKAKDNRKKVLVNDYVINSRSDRKGSGGLSSLKGSVSLICTVLKPRNIQNQYARYLLDNYGFAEEFYRWGHGIVDDLWTTRFDKMKRILIPYPDVYEQKAIASFLDEKTSKVDDLIKIQETAIERLEVFKEAIINDYISDFVFHKSDFDNDIYYFNCVRIDSICDIVRGNSSFTKNDLRSDGDIIALQYGKTYKIDIVDYSFNHYVKMNFHKDSQVCSKGDTIIISTSETMEDLGHTCFYNRDDDGLLGGEQIMLKPKARSIENKFLYYASTIFTKKLRKHATGLKVYRFNTNHLKNIFFDLPSIERQRDIVHELDVKIPKIQELIAVNKEKIEKLNEYKKSLIYEAVTGKIEVM